MAKEFEPWLKYPGLTQERLSTVAAILRDTRSETIRLHDAAGGDSAWSLGCRIYARTCHALTAAAEKHDWLTIVPEKESLRFTFAVGGVPLKFYRGDVGDPPGHCRIVSEAEEAQRQLCLDLEGINTHDRLLRLVVEANSEGLTSSVTLIEMAKNGKPTGQYTIPSDARASKTVPIQHKAIDLPPVHLEPLGAEEELGTQEEKQRKRRDAI